jgi:hypothetical protein
VPDDAHLECLATTYLDELRAGGGDLTGETVNALLDVILGATSEGWDLIGVILDRCENDEELCKVGSFALDAVVGSDPELSIQKLKRMESLHRGFRRAAANTWQTEPARAKLIQTYLASI